MNYPCRLGKILAVSVVLTSPHKAVKYVFYRVILTGGVSCDRNDGGRIMPTKYCKVKTLDTIGGNRTMMHTPIFPGSMTPAQMVRKAANLAAAVLLTAATIAALTALVIITI